MTTFGRYARFYDLLYRDKDYAAECDCLELLFRRHARGRVGSVLDLGCGTGGHALLLAARGYRVEGVDRSQGMLAAARRKAKEAGVESRFTRGDIRTVRLGRTFDAVISMFAVLGYQTEDRDILAALATAEAHLRPGGILVFDVWFGLGVLADPPASRVKRVAGEGTRLVRRTESTMDLARQVVSVCFDVSACRGKAPAEHCREEHRMRFFFPREIDLLLAAAGLKPLLLAPFLRPDDQPGTSDWSVMAVARK